MKKRIQMIAIFMAAGVISSQGTIAVSASSPEGAQEQAIDGIVGGMPYVICGDVGENGWYISEVTVLPADERFEISKTEDGEYSDKIVFDENGIYKRHVYLRNKESKDDVECILLENVCIDCSSPDMEQISVDYGGENEISKTEDVGQEANEKAENEDEIKKEENIEYEAVKETEMTESSCETDDSEETVTITLSAYDEGSGIDYFTCSLRGPSDGGPVEETESDSEAVDQLLMRLEAEPDEAEPGKYTARMTVPKQTAKRMQGNLLVQATNHAGTSSEMITDTGEVFINHPVLNDDRSEESEIIQDNTRQDAGAYRADKSSQSAAVSSAGLIADIAALRQETMLSDRDAENNEYIESQSIDRNDPLSTNRNGNDSESDSYNESISVHINEPVTRTDDVSYYKGAVELEIITRGRSFQRDELDVAIKKNGKVVNSSLKWKRNGLFGQEGDLKLTEDGDYEISISYQGTVIFSSGRITIDTYISVPEILINGSDADGQAVGGSLHLASTFEDANYQSHQISLTRTTMEKTEEDVTNLLLSSSSVTEHGGDYRFDSIEPLRENDGIYRLHISVTDKAGNTADKTAVFSVNRYGSVYEYSDYLANLAGDQLRCVPSIDEDLVITEYNADKLNGAKLHIGISRDGNPLKDVNYSVTPSMDSHETTGSSGLYQYEYRIDRRNFAQDGRYHIVLSSEDSAGNVQDTEAAETGREICFWVDHTSPEIEYIADWKSSEIQMEDGTIQYQVFDAVGLASVQICEDNEVIDEVTDFEDNANRYQGSFLISDADTYGKVTFIVRDKAGNETVRDYVLDSVSADTHTNRNMAGALVVLPGIAGLFISKIRNLNI